MGNCTSSLEALPMAGAMKGGAQELFTKALASKDMAADQLESLISSNVDVNYKMEHDSIGTCYPLHIACKAGNEKAVELLIKAGADTNLTDAKGQTPLHWAIQENHLKIVDELLTNGKADVNLAADNDVTPFYYAIKLNDEEIVEKFIKAGAHVNVEKGEPPLVTAVSGNFVQVIIPLLKAKASPTGLDFQFPEGGPTSLHSWATTNGHDEIARHLDEGLSSSEENPAIQEMEKEIEEANEREGGDGAEEVPKSDAEAPAGDEPTPAEEPPPVENTPEVAAEAESPKEEPSEAPESGGGGDEGGEE